MADPFHLFLFFVFSFLLQLEYSFVHAQCSPTEPCNQGGPVIQFPFWRKGQKSDFCKTPGFELSCNKKNGTILSLPFSGDFIVKDINYDQQLVLINDPDSCLPKRMDNFNLFQSPFIGVFSGRYNFFNCSSNWTYTGGKNVTDRFVQLSCISSKNYTVYVVPSYITVQEIPSSCFNVNESDIEWFNSQYWSAMNAKGDLELKWRMSRLECWDCVRKGLRCGITEDDEVVCVIPEEKESKHGIPRSAKYGIILGAGIPGMLLMIGLGCHICNKIKKYSSQNQLLSTELSTTITPQPVITIIGGLDGQTIESYPKTVLGESRRLPKTSDGTCPICLCEYQPNETLRSIPECNHYFHVDCIDEWLKLNGTCPLCRNSLESFLVTPCTSTFSTSS